MFPLYFDDDSQDRAVVRGLRDRGIDCYVSGVVGTEGLEDDAHLAFAAERGWCLVTRNEADFVVLHRRFLEAGRAHGGIIIVHQWRRLSIGQEVRAHLTMQETLAAADMESSVEYLSHWVPR